MKSVIEKRFTNEFLNKERVRKWQENLLANTVNIYG